MRFWHIASLIIAIAALLHTFAAPAQAIFLSGLNNFCQLSSAKFTGRWRHCHTGCQCDRANFQLNSGDVFVAGAAASLFAYNQAQQGNDWRPIVTQVGLAFAIVIAIDVVTFIFVGNGTGTAGG